MKMDFYVIAASDSTSDSVTLLKAEPLTVDEVNTYGEGHVSKYTYFDQGKVGNWNNNGYGGIVYYTSATCGYPNGSSGSRVTTDCTTDYDESEVKYAVDTWSTYKFNASDLTEDSLGYKARLITLDELQSNLGYDVSVSTLPSQNGETPSWVYNEKYYYLTMSQYEDDNLMVWHVRYDGNLYHSSICPNIGYEAVRPVVTILKSAI